MASVKDRAPLAKSESLNDLDDEYENQDCGFVGDSPINVESDIGETYTSVNVRTQNDDNSNKFCMQPDFVIDGTNPEITASSGDSPLSSGDSPLTGKAGQGSDSYCENIALTDLQNLVHQSLQDYNKKVRNWLNDKIKQSHETEELENLDLDVFQQNENVKEWAFERIKQALGETIEYIDVEDVYDDVLNGDKIEFNGPRDDRINEVLNELYTLGIENARSFLNLSLPLSDATTIRNRYGEVVKILNIQDDATAREKQFERIEGMFGANDKKLQSSMTFSNTMHVFQQKELKEYIREFLLHASDPKSEWACVQATIILNGHGTEDGKIAFAQDNAMGFEEVIDIISDTLALLHDDKKTLNLPFGVMVLNGLCHSYKSGGLNPNSARIQVKYFTDTVKRTTTSTFNLKAVYNPKEDYVVVDAGHKELENEAQETYIRTGKYENPQRDAVDTFVPPEEELIKEKEKVCQAENDLAQGDTRKVPSDTIDDVSSTKKRTPVKNPDDKLTEIGKGDVDHITKDKPRNGVESNEPVKSKKINQSDGPERIKKKKSGKNNNTPLDAATTKCAKCSLM